MQHQDSVPGFQPPPPPPAPSGSFTPFAGGAQAGSFLPPTPPRTHPHATESLGHIGSHSLPGLTEQDLAGSYYGSPAPVAAAAGGYTGAGWALGPSPAGGGAAAAAGGMFGGAGGHGMSPLATSPARLPPAVTAAELLYGGGSSSMFGEQQQQQQQHMGRATGPAPSASRAISNMLQQQHMQQFGTPHDPSLVAAAAAAAAGLPPAYQASPLSQAATVSAQQLLQQQQQQIARSLSVDIDIAGGYGGYGAGGGRWGGRLGGDLAGVEHGRLFGAVYDMKSLTAALCHVQAATGDVRRLLASCTFRPRLPGLTKLVSQLSREGNWAKALEVYESLDAVGIRPDTTITNAAISACDKGAQWEKALQVFRSMADIGLERDAITYSALISALSKGRQWSLAIDVFNHMVAEGVECDAVTCCSLITALDKGGQWRLAEEVFIQMYQSHKQFHVLLEGMQQDPSGSSPNKPLTNSPSSLLAGTFSAAALNALSIQEDSQAPTEQLARLTEPVTTPANGSASGESYRGWRVLGSTAALNGAVWHADGPEHRQVGSSNRRLGGLKDLPTAAVAAASPIDCNGAAAAAGAAAASQRGPECSLGSPDGKTTCQSFQDCLDSPTSSSSSSSVRTCQASRHAAAYGLISTVGSSSVRSSKAVVHRSLAVPEIAAVGLMNPGSSLAKPDSGSGFQDSDSNIVRTLSGAWSRVIGAKQAAKVADAVVDHGSSVCNAAQWRASSSSGDSCLSASDAIVVLAEVLPPTATGDASQQIIQQQQQQSSPGVDPSKSLSAQLADIGLLPPTSAAAAAVKDDEPAAAGNTSPPPTAAPPPAAAAGHYMSPGRPPPHTPRRAESAFTGSSSSGALSSLQRGPSAQIGSPSGNIGLRLGRAGSLNSKKSSPNRVCCNALLAAYARAVPPRWKQALKLLNVMWQCGGELVPDIVSYNTVMKACGNAQQTDIAFQLYHHMQQHGIEPTVATYGTLITIASEAQDYSKVKESWGWLQASGLPVHVTCVNSYLTALIKEDNWDAAVDLFNQLKSNQLGVRPNSVTYNILMSACLARDKPHTVRALFDEMTSCSLSPTLISFNTLLHAYGKMGQWHDSLALITHLCGSSAVRPSATSFNTVFCTLSNVAAAMGDLDKQMIQSRALEVYTLMLNQPGIHPDTTLYRNMIATFSACKAHQMVLTVTLNMTHQGHSLDPATAAAAMDALQQQGAWGLAGQLLRSCYDAGALVSNVMLECVLLSCANEGAWKAAREVLQVTASTNQLDSIAQLLQQYRVHLQTAHTTGQVNPAIPTPPGLINPDSLDELLFLTFLQAQYNTGGWAPGLELFRQLRSDRGLGFAAGNAAVHGALLELLVVRGGAEGLVAAVQIVDECHLSGAMAHYLIHPTSGSSPITSQACPSTPGVAPGITAALSTGLLSPEQQLILQLEHASISTSSPPSSAAAAGSSILSPCSFGVGQVGGSIPASLGMSAGGFGLEGLVGSGAGMTAPLSFLDVQGCSAIEAVVLLLSYLGQIVQAQASGGAVTVEHLRILTGGIGAPSKSELDQVVFYKPLATGVAGADSADSSTAQAESSASNTAAAAAAAGESSSAAEVGGRSTPGDQGVPAAASGSSPTSKDVVPAPTDEVVGPNQPAQPPPPPAATSARPNTISSSFVGSSSSSSANCEVPCSKTSVHTAVLAVLNGQLGPMLKCGSAMDLLVPFSGSARLALGLLCCSALPLLLPDESHGGGVWLPVRDMRQSIASALDASRA